MAQKTRLVADVIHDTLAERGVRDPWTTTMIICERLAASGVDRAPSAQTVLDALARAQRNDAIRRDFKGNNHRALGQQHGISVRQVRRIVDAKPQADHGR